MNPSLFFLPLLWGLGADAGAPQLQEEPPPPALDAVVRGLLKKRMQGHGRDQTRLVTAVTLLERDLVNPSPRRAAEPRFGAAEGWRSGRANSALPERFFVLQEALQLRARALAEAADKKDDVGVAKSFGQLVETCVTRHSAFPNRK